ncbi:hypothetical protein CRENBAI_015736 [Crenichthys baileyi]|uniref:Uncharacterized protein n=1 Tax=Crenichthys baileyi TaxID=28760 RepID=A0AAV9RRC6_9TELE
MDTFVDVSGGPRFESAESSFMDKTTLGKKWDPCGSKPVSGQSDRLSLPLMLKMDTDEIGGDTEREELRPLKTHFVYSWRQDSPRLWYRNQSETVVSEPVRDCGIGTSPRLWYRNQSETVESEPVRDCGIRTSPRLWNQNQSETVVSEPTRDCGIRTSPRLWYQNQPETVESEPV